MRKPREQEAEVDMLIADIVLDVETLKVGYHGSMYCCSLTLASLCLFVGAIQHCLLGIDQLGV